MKKLTALILTAVMLVCMTAIVPVSAEGNVVELVPSANNPVTVNAGDTDVEIAWDFATNDGWNILSYFIEFDADVFSWPVDPVVIEADSWAEELDRFDYTFFNDCKKSVMNKLGDVMITNNYDGNDDITRFDVPVTLDFNMDAATYGDYTDEFFKIYLDVAENAPTGDYEIKFTWDAINCVDKAPSKLDVKEVETIVIHVDGVEPPKEYDERLTAGAAQLRVPQDEAMAEKFGFGFRFVSEIEQEFAEKDGVVYGVLVAPTKVLDGAELDLDYANANIDKVVNIANTDANFKTMGVENGKVQFNATMINIKEDKYAADYTFTVVTYATDNGVTTYSEPVTDLTIRSIAQKYVDDTENDYTEYAKKFVTALVLG